MGKLIVGVAALAGCLIALPMFFPSLHKVAFTLMSFNITWGLLLAAAVIFLLMKLQASK